MFAILFMFNLKKKINARLFFFLYSKKRQREEEMPPADFRKGKAETTLLFDRKDSHDAAEMRCNTKAMPPPTPPPPPPCCNKWIIFRWHRRRAIKEIASANFTYLLLLLLIIMQLLFLLLWKLWKWFRAINQKRSNSFLSFFKYLFDFILL